MPIDKINCIRYFFMLLIYRKYKIEKKHSFMYLVLSRRDEITTDLLFYVVTSIGIKQPFPLITDIEFYILNATDFKCFLFHILHLQLLGLYFLKLKMYSSEAD